MQRPLSRIQRTWWLGYVFLRFCFYISRRAAELMVKSGPNVTLRISKQSAIYHGLATLLSQPSPMVTKGRIIQSFLVFCRVVLRPIKLTQRKR